MKRYFLILSIILFGLSVLKAQNTYTGGILIDKDTIPHVNLDQVNVFPKSQFKSKQEEQQYWRLVWRVKKVYPYAKEAARLYEKYKLDVPPSARRKDRRTYVKKAEDELMALYGPKLKQLSIIDGRILIKLIDRETNTTSFNLIDEVKGAVPAVFWQGIARIFGNNLKSHYDPYGEDRQIEQIIRYIEAGLI